MTYFDCFEGNWGLRECEFWFEDKKGRKCESMLCAQWLRRGLKQTAGVLGRLWYPLHAHLFTRFLHRCPGRGSFLQGRERRRRAGGCVSQGPLSKAIARGWQLMGPTFLRWQIRILFSNMRMWCPCVFVCVCVCVLAGLIMAPISNSGLLSKFFSTLYPHIVLYGTYNFSYLILLPVMFLNVSRCL